MHPVRVRESVGAIAAQVRIGLDHAMEQPVNSLAHLPRADPLAAYSTLPVLLEVLLAREGLAFGRLEGCSSDENLEERYTECPHICLARVVGQSTSAFRAEVLGCSVRQVGMEGPCVLRVVLLREAEVDENGYPLFRKEDIGRPGVAKIRVSRTLSQGTSDDRRT